MSRWLRQISYLFLISSYALGRWFSVHGLICRTTAPHEKWRGRSICRSTGSPVNDFPSGLSEDTRSVEAEELQAEGQAHPQPRMPTNRFVHNPSWLEDATNALLNEEEFPIGELSEDHVSSIPGLMGFWAKRGSLDSALIVERLLKRVVDDMNAGNSAAVITTRFYSHAIDAWARSGAKGAAQRAQLIHDAMIQLHEKTGNKLIAPSTDSYTSVMSAWSKSDDPFAAHKAHDLLTELIESMKDGHELAPDSHSFATVLYAYSRSNAPDRVERSENLFATMKELGIPPNRVIHSNLQNVYARSGARDAPEKAQAVLDEMVKSYEAGEISSPPTISNYNDVLNALSRTSSRDSAQRAQEMLTRIELPVEQGGYDVRPDRLTYNFVVLACARSPDPKYAAKAAEFNLERLEERTKLEAKRKDEISSAAPAVVFFDIESFNIVLTTLSKSGAVDAPERCLAIIKRMQEYADAGNESVRPSLRSWNAVLNCFSRTAHRQDTDFGLQSLKILDRMLTPGGGGLNVVPNVFTFAAVLHAQQRCRHPKAAERADNLLRRMEALYEAGSLATPPDVFHYTILLNTWSKSESPQAPDRCLQILMHMYRRAEAGFEDTKPNVRTYNAVLFCLTKVGDADRAESLLYHMLDRYQKGDELAKPDSYSFNRVIVVFSRSKERGAGMRAEATLDRFLEFHEQHPEVSPDIWSFRDIINHYGRSKALDAPYRGEYVLNRMVNLFESGEIDVQPNAELIISTMDGYSYANHPDSGKNAERLLKLLEKLQRSGCEDVAVTTTVMKSVLFAWSASAPRDEEAGYHAEAILKRMEEAFEQGDESLQPNTKSYGLVLSTWSKSQNPQKARRALELLRRMESRQENNQGNFRVDPHAYALVINTCAFCNFGESVESEAFDIASQVFNEMLTSKEKGPSFLAYGWYIQACGRLTIESSRAAEEVEKAFVRCCEDGLLHDFVFKRFRTATSDELFSSILERMKAKETRKSRLLQNTSLPRKWRRNC